MKPLNLFYSEPDPDRWFAYDRYPRQIIRRLIRGKRRPGGQEMVAFNLLKGLDKLDIPYRFNNYRYIKSHPKETVGIIGKPHVLFNNIWKNPIVFGASVFAHPLDCPNLFDEYPNVKKILVPGEWMKNMFEPYYKEKVVAWPVGIDTEEWNIPKQQQLKDFLIYYKVLWDKTEYNNTLFTPIVDILKKRNLSFEVIEYSRYKPLDLKKALAKVKACIFLSLHETQGLAYQQILASGTPILAWNKGGHWVDPSFYPHKVQFEPVSSVPYWDERCGEIFHNALDFEEELEIFLKKRDSIHFKPRSFILDNLTLEKAAKRYVDIYNTIAE
jgi:hypothetical protein